MQLRVALMDVSGEEGIVFSEAVSVLKAMTDTLFIAVASCSEGCAQ